MKLTFTSIDVRAAVSELQKSVVGLRVNQIYDVDHKTYLMKLQKPDHKAVLVLESAARLHTTDYEWPKSPAPSGFSMKLRKHLRNKRLESVQQLGVDRVVQLTFGSGPAQHHLIVELYDRGNITLTDADYTILIILRPRKDGEDTRFAAHEVYPISSFRSVRPPPTLEQISKALQDAKPSVSLKKILNPLLDCGGGVVEHELTVAGLGGLTVASVRADQDKLPLLVRAAEQAQQYMQEPRDTKGYIIQRSEERLGMDGSRETVLLYQEFHPILYQQHSSLPYVEHQSFNQACDDFFQQLESQKLQQRSVLRQKEALKKLDNVRSDHSSRVDALIKLQDQDTMRGQLIELNQQLVDAAICEVRAALAHQLDWREIAELLEEAQEREEPVSCAIRKLSLATNSITMILSDPYSMEESDLLLDSDEEREEGCHSDKNRPVTVDIDLDLTAHANARRYYTSRRKAVTKVQKTMAASEAALKSATRKTKQTLKEVHTTTVINKLRKVHWFEKFLWFISSENYLVLAGHDQSQNELLVKRHLKSNDVYVHADLHGASSVIVKNNSSGPVPPATLHQAGIMALCYSRAWAEKVVTSAWWVWGHQVSKSAPTGEYLTTGSFMVRGKKNFLPPSHLVYGFGFLFRLEESSISRHEGERRVKALDEEAAEEAAIRLGGLTVQQGEADEDQDIAVADDDEDDDEEEEQDEGASQDEDKTTRDIVQDAASAAAAGSESDGGEKGVKKEKEKDEDDPGAVEFPDTCVEMTHVRGDTFAVSAVTRNPSHSSPVVAADTAPPDTKAAAPHHKRKPRAGRKKVSICENGTDGKSSTKSTQGAEHGSEGAEHGSEEAELALKEGKSSTKEEGPKAVRAGPISECSSGDNDATKNGPIKRGQKSRLKKMKTKYKDQDEEERELRMQLLQSDGAQKAPKRPKGKKAKKMANLMRQNNLKNAQGKPAAAAPPAAAAAAGGQAKQQAAKTDTAAPAGGDAKQEQQEGKENQVKKEEEEEEDDDEEEEEVGQVSDDLAILMALTGQPVAEDELLYCVPVCAPYTALANYKYKVKLTPGNGKKGKACKMAVSLFLATKPPVNRECDLLRAVRDSDLARNVPGKVKVSAPNMSKVRK